MFTRFDFNNRPKIGRGAALPLKGADAQVQWAVPMHLHTVSTFPPTSLSPRITTICCTRNLLESLPLRCGNMTPPAGC